MWQSLFSLRGLGPCGFFSVTSASAVLRGFAFVCSMFVCSLVRADYPAATAPATVWCTGTGCAASQQASCDQAFPSSPAGTFVATRINDSYYSCKHKTTGGIGTYTTARLDYCPYGGTYNSSTKICVGADAPPPENPCSDTNQFIRRWNYPAGGVTPPPSSYDGCKIEVISMLVCRKDPAAVTYCMWLVKRTGEPSSDAPDPGSSSTPDNPKDPPTNSPPIKPPPAPPGKNPCPQGTVQAGSDPSGIPICMGQGSNPRNPPAAPPKVETEKSETLPDGSTKTTKTTTTTNADGSTTTQTDITTTKPDGSKETTQDRNTGLNSAGQAGTQSTPEQDQNNLCKQNPHLSVCRESSVSGTCGEVTCVGDAIQCATLRAASAMQCKQKADEDALKASPLTGKGQAAIDGTDLVNLPSPGKGQIVNIGSTMQGSQGWLGAGSAFDDVSFSVQGHQVIVPLSKWSGYLESLRYVMMIIASLISFRILGTAILKE